MLLILSDWHKARGPAWLAIAAWMTPLLGLLLWVFTDFFWLALPLVWSSLLHGLMIGAAAWTVWLAIKSGPASESAA
jgi:hypothetical protein